MQILFCNKDKYGPWTFCIALQQYFTSCYHAGPAVKKPEACHVLCHSEPRSLLHRSIAGVDVDHRCGWRALIAALRLYQT